MGGKSATQRHVGIVAQGQQCPQSAACVFGRGAGTGTLGAGEEAEPGYGGLLSTVHRN